MSVRVLRSAVIRERLRHFEESRLEPDGLGFDGFGFKGHCTGIGFENRIRLVLPYVFVPIRNRGEFGLLHGHQRLSSERRRLVGPFFLRGQQRIRRHAAGLCRILLLPKFGRPRIPCRRSYVRGRHGLVHAPMRTHAQRSENRAGYRAYDRVFFHSRAGIQRNIVECLSVQFHRLGDEDRQLDKKTDFPSGRSVFFVVRGMSDEPVYSFRISS